MLENRYSHRGKFGLVGESPVMQNLYRSIEKVSPYRTAVVLKGETGTGKEKVARAIHNLSGREVFVVVNCAAIAETLVESELFGHRKGAFTGAHSNSSGYMEIADGGTLFLDEIDALPKSTQVKLLRAVEYGEVEKVGDKRPEKRTVDVRVISATSKDLNNEVEEGRFREDLYHRLNGYRLDLPPLRDRISDIGLLAEYFLDCFNIENAKALESNGGPKIYSPNATNVLRAYPWPGNVRQLKNVVDRSIISANGVNTVTEEDISVSLDHAAGMRDYLDGLDFGKLFLNTPLSDVKKAFERWAIKRALEITDGNKKQAAEILGESRSTLHRKVANFEL